MAQARTYVDSATSEQLETRLQQLLLNSGFSDAALLIEASTHLSSRYQTADVVRLMLEKAKSLSSLEKAAQLFGAAVRLAQEMVPNFEQLSAAADRPCWSPSALIQAMIRARKFRAALRSAKQFGLLDMFPAPQLVAGMLETRSWEEAVSSVMEMHLFKEFPLARLAVEMMQQQQWSQAVKCINKLSDNDNTRTKFCKALLDQGNGDAALSLLRDLVDAMILQNEFYKAIKYAIKFNLSDNPLNDTNVHANGPKMPPMDEKNVGYLPQYNVEHLIRKTMKAGQHHVALTYIRKLRLRDKFAEELVEIKKVQQIQLQEFRQFARLRLAQLQDPAYQENLCILLSDFAEDEMTELDPIEKEIVLFEEKVIPRKVKDRQVGMTDKLGGKESVMKKNAFFLENNEFVDKQQQFANPAEAASQSRFGFARSPSFQSPILAVDAANTDTQFCSRLEPPSRVSLIPSIISLDTEPSPVNTQDCADYFNFDSFARSVSLSGPPPSHRSLNTCSLPPQPPQQQPVLSQHQQNGPKVSKHSMPSVLNCQFAGGPSGYNLMPPMMIQQMPTYCSQGGNLPEGVQLCENLQSTLIAQPNGGGSLDVASLAMQFHISGNSNTSPNFGPRSFMNSSPPSGCQELSGIKLQMPPRPPQSNFKPSMSYTSVTTTRQKN
ncbi:NUCLEIC ACID BINDING PROTEIN [Plasmopara halstedii]|uniref:NUCLEIC ACID BINDING PROTEIN n=1 Tax=Plasmopara halstedii TaxID=4781 RepID=A0A0P1AAI6_PLAHL|nr:NUCLEIC ACID BINDING PROTEIN [Plasmopara halstedii]CEG37344.1 NUCLEIC ACID BINDING PROTEIN [Plasmopara halstedii]|eukprot:XP_024573713.1 NUCLEIC ACID BINDING PROTEIN [Plasmopara halstedii]